VIRIPFTRPFPTGAELDYIRAAIAALKFSGGRHLYHAVPRPTRTVAWCSEGAPDHVLHPRAGDGCATPGYRDLKTRSWFPKRFCFYGSDFVDRATHSTLRLRLRCSHGSVSRPCRTTTAHRAVATERMRQCVLFYSRSMRVFNPDGGTTVRFTGLGLPGMGSTIHLQPTLPALSEVQAAPPRFQISICQRELLAGIANAYVTAAVIITPHSIPIKNMRMIFLLLTILL
jgi:hypothetical protein